jgi:hypothetical protein
MRARTFQRSGFSAPKKRKVRRAVEFQSTGINSCSDSKEYDMPFKDKNGRMRVNWRKRESERLSEIIKSIHRVIIFAAVVHLE